MEERRRRPQESNGYRRGEIDQAAKSRVPAVKKSHHPERISCLAEGGNRARVRGLGDARGVIRERNKASVRWEGFRPQEGEKLGAGHPGKGDAGGKKSGDFEGQKRHCMVPHVFRLRRKREETDRREGGALGLKKKITARSHEAQRGSEWAGHVLLEEKKGGVGVILHGKRKPLPRKKTTPS